jgi:hypothetical protein
MRAHEHRGIEADLLWGAMTIGGGIAIVLAYVLVSMGVVVAFLWAAFMIGCSSGAGATVVANTAENFTGRRYGR